MMRYIIRQLLESPGFTIVAIVGLALGSRASAFFHTAPHIVG
jgi:hypothetical protein